MNEEQRRRNALIRRIILPDAAPKQSWFAKCRNNKLRKFADKINEHKAIQMKQCCGKKINI